MIPSALSVPTCDPRWLSGAWIMRTSVERNAKQTIMVTPRVRAIFTMVHRKSSRCSRNGFDVSVSGGSRNLKMSRRAIEPEAQRGASDRRPRAASVAQMPSVLASQMSLSAIMRRISATVNWRQSRIDSPSSRLGPSAHG